MSDMDDKEKVLRMTTDHELWTFVINAGLGVGV